ncbi:sulfite exporter TauE/SafE family protein [Ahrensia kielensis]|uniref:sulfite exporter TauE/SafE family protein n=1 Tax=Ahrensia kielensis TaxID=76980 RepID=UPI00036A93B1|nr:sulfite exporter TauE/SafE family protein [Ahrensia kielensis]
METLGLFLLASLIVGASKGGLASAGALAVPILSIWMDPLMAAGALLPIFIISDAMGVWLYRKEFSRKNVLLLIPAGLGGVILATFLAPYVSSTYAELAAGLIGLFYCGHALHKKLRGQDPVAPFDPIKGVLWGIITGITSFISHTGAPPFQSFVQPQKLPSLQYAGTNTLVFAAINLFKLPAYSAVGLFAKIHVPTVLAMAVVASMGAVLGRWLVQWLPQQVFTLVIQLLLFVVSSYLVIKALGHLID